jgi:hypothetical protein
VLAAVWVLGAPAIAVSYLSEDALEPAQDGVIVALILVPTVVVSWRGRIGPR